MLDRLLYTRQALVARRGVRQHARPRKPCISIHMHHLSRSSPPCRVGYILQQTALPPDRHHKLECLLDLPQLALVRLSVVPPFGLLDPRFGRDQEPIHLGGAGCEGACTKTGGQWDRRVGFRPAYLGLSSWGGGGEEEGGMRPFCGSALPRREYVWGCLPSHGETQCFP